MSLDFDTLVAQLATVQRWPKDLSIEALTAVLDEHDGALPRNAALTLAERTGWSARQLYRWRTELLAERPGADPDAPFTDLVAAGGASAFRFDELALTMLYLVGGNMRRFRDEVIAAGYPMPSLPTLSRRWREQVPRHVRDGARHGQKRRYTNLFYIRHSAEEPDAAWQLDAVSLDLRTLLERSDVRPTKGEEEPKTLLRRDTAEWVARRPELLLLIDDHSRFITGWAMLSHRANSEDTMALFADAFEVRPADDGSGVPIGGPPDVIVCDNASEFRSRVVETMVGGFGRRITPTPAYSPAAKGKVERVIQTIQADVITGLAGLLSVAERINRHHSFETPAESWLEFSQVEELVAAVVHHYNYERVHSSLGATPFEVYSSRPGPRMTPTDEELAVHYLPDSRGDGTRKVQATDGVHYAGGYWLDPNMNTNYIGKRLEVRTLHHRLDRIALFDGDEFVGMALPNGKLDEEQRRALKTRRVGEVRAVSRYSKLARVALERRTAAIATAADASALTAAEAAVDMGPTAGGTAAGPARPASRPPRRSNDTSKVTKASTTPRDHAAKQAALDAEAAKKRKGSSSSRRKKT